jgi:hypothetical protein
MPYGFPEEVEGGYRIYDDVPGQFSISWDGQWLDGIYPTRDAALAAGRYQVEHWEEYAAQKAAERKAEKIAEVLAMESARWQPLFDRLAKND